MSSFKDTPVGQDQIAALRKIAENADLVLRASDPPRNTVQGLLIDILVAVLDVAGDSAIDEARSCLREIRHERGEDTDD